MKKNIYNSIVFVIIISILVLLIIVFYKNIDNITNDYKNLEIEVDANIHEQKENINIRDKIDYYNSFIRENKGTVKKVKKLPEDDIAQKYAKAFNLENALENQLQLADNGVEWIGLDFYKDNKNWELFYTQDGQNIYFCEMSAMYFYDNKEEVILEEKDKLINLCTNKLNQLKLDNVLNFKPNYISKIGNNIYGLYEKENNRLVNYNYESNEIIGIMIKE